MSSNRSVRRAVRCALVSGAAVAVAGVLPAWAAEEVENVVVTGSRIARPDIEATVPVQIISSEAIAEQGSPNIADILQELPAMGTPGLSRNNSNFLTSSNGVSTINLRNMDDKRTLVLINGRRIVSGVGGTSTVDVNNIPTDLVENVQVLTGGASAVYGSEAIAGVVNFVLKDDFEGVGLRAQTGLTSEGDRKQNLVALTFGQNIGDRGNVTLNIQYDKDDGLRSREREISANDNPSRSAYVPQGYFFPNAGEGAAYEGSDWTYNASNQLQNSFDPSVDGFNRNPERYIAVPLERVLYTALAHYEVTEHARLFFEGSYSEMDSRSRLEPLATDNSDAVLPDGTTSEGLTRDNPFIPAAVLADMIAAEADTLTVIKRMNNVFDRSNVNTRDFHRFVVGMNGDVFDGWNWEVYYNQSETKEYTASETALRDRYYYALDAITGPDGTPNCRDATARANGCVPFNPFGFNSVSSEAATYITNGGQLDTYDATVKQRVAAANLTGSLFSLPAGDVMIATGVERRWEESAEEFSADTQSGNTMGNALSNTSGEYTVNEVYLETIVPILKDLPAANSLEFEGAVRLGDYSTVDEVVSWKSGLSWAPVDSVRLRAVYSKATRAPNIGELYQGANQTFPTGLTDPCAGVTAVSTRPQDAYCRSLPGVAQSIASTGSFTYTLRDTQSIEGEDRGNPNVEEEVAQTWTVGFVFTPAFAPNLTLSLDWFEIQIDDAIALIPRQYAIDQCVATAGTSPFCALEVREGASTPRPRTPGTIYQIDSNFINAASIKTKGIDVATAYSFDFAANQSLRLALAYTHLDQLEQEPLEGEPPQDNLGQLASGQERLGAGFEHRANASVTYGIGDFTGVWRVNYMSSMKDTLDENSPALPPQFNNVDAYTYHDLQLRYDFGADQQYNAYLGIDNVFDKEPPVINQLGASHITGTETAADTYDPIGRFLYGGVVLKF